MSIIEVSSSAELLAALSKAQGGDEIRLSSGSYEGIRIQDVHFDVPVTITSSDPGSMAVLHDLQVTGSSGLTFSTLEFAEIVEDRDLGFTVYGSSNISFEDLKVHGPDNMGSGIESALMMIRNSSSVSVTGSEFYSASYAINMLNNDGVTISDNFFHDIRIDGVHAGDVSNLTVDGNLFTDFHPVTGDHPDAIQIWSTGQYGSMHDISITDNMVVRGTGEMIQGVFIHETNGGATPYYNVSITGNLVSGGMGNGIMLNNAVDSVIADNVVQGYEDSKSWIRVTNVSQTVIEDNQSAYYLADGVNVTKEVTADGTNALIALATDSGEGVVSSWLKLHPDFLTGQSLDLGRVYSLFGFAAPETPSDTTTPVDTGPDTVTDTDGSTGDSGGTDGGSPDSGSSDTPAVVTPEDGGGDSDTKAGLTFETVSGTSGNDLLKVVKGVATLLEGGDGNDVLHGGAGDHILAGGAGDDQYLVRDIGNIVREEADGGTDRVYSEISYTLGDNVENLNLMKAGLTGTGNALDNRMGGSTGTDILYGLDGNDLLQGSDGDDFLYGGNGNDELRGGTGHDVLEGGAGNDLLLGNEGNDILIGGAGDDRLEGGEGADVMTGGEGADLFRFRSDHLSATDIDIITDFQSGTDKIELNLIDANILTSKNDAFTFIGDSAFTHSAGQLQAIFEDGDIYLNGDLNGDAVADFSILLQNVTSIDVHDIIL